MLSFFRQLGRAGFQADPIFGEANDEYVVDIHRGWTTEGVGRVDTTWALVWRFDAAGRANFALAPLPIPTRTASD